MEVLVAFSILSLLLTSIIQGQGESVYFLEKTKKLEIVQKEVSNTLLAVERGTRKAEDETGTFPDEHPLAGDQWQMSSSSEMLLELIPVTRISYSVTWVASNKIEQTFESSILQ